MSVSFLDSSVVKEIRKNILKLNLGVTFDANQTSNGQSALTDRGTFASVNQLNPNIIDEPRVLDLQEPYSISLLRKNKYGSTEDGYRLVSVEENPREFLGNESKIEYDELVQPYLGNPISEGGSRIVDVKTLILNNNINSYQDTPLGLIGIRALDKLLKENIAANIQSSTINRFNDDPVSLLKGNSLIIPDRTISKVDPTLSDIKNPINFLKAGVSTVNEYLGYTYPVSLIPESAIGWQEFNKGRNRKRRESIDRGDTKFDNFLDGLDKFGTGVSNTGQKLFVGNPLDLSTEARMEELLKYTGEGQKELIFNNLSQNIFQPGYTYQQSLLKAKTLSNFQANTISRNLVNRGTKDVYGVVNNKLRYEKLGVRGAYDIDNNNDKFVLKSNGMVRIAPDKDNRFIKNYMFSIENLAWADVSDAFISESERGVGDPATGLRGKMMWFPPYDLKVSDDTAANWEGQDFIGRPEPVYTYNNSERSGSLSFKILVDHPSIINSVKGSDGDILEKYFNGEVEIKDFTKKTNTTSTEDEKRAYLRNIVGNTKRDKYYGVPTKSEVDNAIPKLNVSLSPPPDPKLPPSFWSDVENSWFTELKVNDPITFKYLAEKIQYFHPAFHSTSPEGFNARLTFLQQCMRQGPSITEGGRATGNLAFGRPPVCILRVGDFYNTKVIFESLSISYDDASWDLNSDGIGVQPMIANITMNFKYIGGSSLTGPINKLQNSLSFNFYANTEVYEQRSDYWDQPNNKEKSDAAAKGIPNLNAVLRNGTTGSKIDPNEEKTTNVGGNLKNPINVNQVGQQNNYEVSNSGGQKTQPKDS